MPTAPGPVRHSAVLAGISPAQAYGVVVDFRAYPLLFPEIREARILGVEGRTSRVEFRGNIVLPFRYVLDLDCDPAAGRVSWRFVEGEVVKDSVGGWRFAAEAGGARVDYEVAMRIEAPVPGFLLRKITDGLVKASLPAMFEAVRREAVRRGAV